MLRSLSKHSNKGFASIVEVVVTSIIFVLATAGIISTVSMLRPHGQESSKKIEAAYLGKAVLENLRKDVVADGVDGFGQGLYDGLHYHVNLPVSSDPGNYSVSYDVTQPAGNPDVRRVTMDITWPDP